MTLMTRPYMRGIRKTGIDINDPSLVLYLPFYDQHPDMTGTTIYSQDRSRRTCTSTNTIWGSQGRTFAGDGKISAAITDPPISGDMTLLFRITPSALTDYGIVCCQYAEADKGFLVDIFADGRIRFVENPGAGEVSIIYYGGISVDVRHFFAVTVKDQLLKIWNVRTGGSASEVAGAVGGIAASTKPIEIGSSSDGGAAISALVEDVFLYNSCLSDSEIIHKEIITRRGMN